MKPKCVLGSVRVFSLRWPLWGTFQKMMCRPCSVLPQKKVTRVEFPTKPLLPSQSTLLKRVAAYARVSTMKDAQENSLQSQQEYFTEYIRQHPDWVFAGMYTDDGVSGLSIRSFQSPDKTSLRAQACPQRR